MVQRTNETPVDSLLTFREVLRIIGRPRMAVSTVHRWRTPGVMVDGRRVCLVAERLGGTWYTTLEALETFLAACNPQPAAGTDPRPRLVDDAQRRAEIAGEHLDAMLNPQRGRPRKVSA